MNAFTQGQSVRIANRRTLGHSRVPNYARGMAGTIERVLTAFLIPEDDAFARPNGRKKTLYRVRFAVREVWPDYRGSAADEIQLEVYEHWLEPLSEVRT